MNLKPSVKNNIFWLSLIVILTGALGNYARGVEIRSKPLLSPLASTQYKEPKAIPPIEDKIFREVLDTFKNESPVNKATMLYIIAKESSFRMTAKNWNCKYDGKSTSCKKGDEDNAYSVDCGLIQRNFNGKNCPHYSFDYKWSIAEAYKLFKQRGFQPWVSYWYLK